MGRGNSRIMSLFVVMGVSGCGKSTVARQLAQATGGEFLDADDFHPFANREKMAAGIPLQDEDRWGWLELLNEELKGRNQSPKPTFLACSALKQIYRNRLSRDLDKLTFIYLRGSKECIRKRLEERTDHFMPPTLLESQFATLEEPSDALIISIEQSLPEVMTEILQALKTLP